MAAEAARSDVVVEAVVVEGSVRVVADPGGCASRIWYDALNQAVVASVLARVGWMGGWSCAAR